MSQEKIKTSRRGFLGQAALGGVVSVTEPSTSADESTADEAISKLQELNEGSGALEYPRVFTAEHLSMIAFPLGGVGAGSVSLGGRGQLRDWEIFNRADKGNNLSYALPSIWVQTSDGKRTARVLEARYQPPYEGQNGLGSENAPGFPRLASARFTGEYPFSRIDFEDDAVPVRVSLEAFSPFIPHEPDDSGLPMAVLRYRVSNPGLQSTRVALAWSIENPVIPPDGISSRNPELDKRTSEFRSSSDLSGLFMTNPGLIETDLFHGSFLLALLNQGDGKLSYLRGWPYGRWWNSPLLFWDDFSADGELGAEAERRNAVGALCLSRIIRAGGQRRMSFFWRGIFQIELRPAAAGRHRRERRTSLSATGIQWFW